jgi:hypothetical protein
MDTIYRIRSSVLRAEGQKVEGIDRRRIEKRLREVRKRDPQAKLLAIPAGVR